MKNKDKKIVTKLGYTFYSHLFYLKKSKNVINIV